MITFKPTTFERATLAFRCVDLTDPVDIEELRSMTERSREISFDTFARHVDWKPLARDMGYAVKPGEKGLRLDQDRHVSFRVSAWRGERVYYMVHSSIEFVFRVQSPRKAIRPSSPWGDACTPNTAPLEQEPSPARRRPRP